MNHTRKTPVTALALTVCLALAAPAAARPGDASAGSSLRAEPSAELSIEPNAELTAVQWKAFGRNLVAALRTPNQGLQAEAMRLAIQYADRVNVRPAKIDLMRVYREADDESVRRMAVVAMGTLGDGFTIGYLQRAARFEKSAPVRQTMEAVVANHR